MSRKQTETITIRLTKEEKLALEKKMYDALSPSMRRFILDMCMTGKVIVNEDLRAVNRELKYQGNNLNQLVHLAHEGRVRVINLSETLSVYQKTLMAMEKQNGDS